MLKIRLECTVRGINWYYYQTYAVNLVTHGICMYIIQTIQAHNMYVVC